MDRQCVYCNISLGVSICTPDHRAAPEDWSVCHIFESLYFSTAISQYKSLAFFSNPSVM